MNVLCWADDVLCWATNDILHPPRRNCVVGTQCISDHFLPMGSVCIQILQPQDSSTLNFWVTTSYANFAFQIWVIAKSIGWAVCFNMQQTLYISETSRASHEGPHWEVTYVLLSTEQKTRTRPNNQPVTKQSKQASTGTFKQIRAQTLGVIMIQPLNYVMCHLSDTQNPPAYSPVVTAWNHTDTDHCVYWHHHAVVAQWGACCCWFKTRLMFLAHIILCHDACWSKPMRPVWQKHSCESSRSANWHITLKCTTQIKHWSVHNVVETRVMVQPLVCFLTTQENQGVSNDGAFDRKNLSQPPIVFDLDWCRAPELRIAQIGQEGKKLDQYGNV